MRGRHRALYRYRLVTAANPPNGCPVCGVVRQNQGLAATPWPGRVLTR